MNQQRIMGRDALDINRSYRQAIVLAVDDLENEKAIFSLLKEEYDVLLAHAFSRAGP